MRSKLFFATALLSAAAYAGPPQTLTRTDKLVQPIPLAMFGTFWIKNPLGPVEVIGVDADQITLTAVKTVFADDQEVLNQAREQCAIAFEGDERVRLVRSLRPTVPRSNCTIAYSVQVPRTADVKVEANVGNLTVRNVNGAVSLRSFSGTVLVSGVTGASTVDLVNGRIVYDYVRAPIGNSRLTVINGDIDLLVPPDANFEWSANTLAGDLLTNMPVRGDFAGTAFRGHFNSPGGPTLQTMSVAGRVWVLSRGSGRQQARSVRISEHVRVPRANYGIGGQEKIRIPVVGGSFDLPYAGKFVDVSVDVIKGPARVETGGGEITLNVVYDDCNVINTGGPLFLGEIMGSLQARTGGGDILVRAARVGGDIRTKGGSIQLLYTGGPTTLETGGGDIIVRQAAGAINATTPSGDITITMDPNVKTQHVDARTLKGNIVFNVTPRFAADIDATIITSDPDSNEMQSDFTGLSIRKEQIAGGKTRIRMTGKINGGGDKVELYSEGGNVSVTTQAPPSVTVISPVQQ